MPTPHPRHERIRAEARQAATRWRDLGDACPYPWGSAEAEVFKAEFVAALLRLDAAPPPSPNPTETPRMQLLWRLFARFVTQPRVSDWIIRRAQRTPYTHIPSRDGNGTYMRRWWLFNPYGKDAQGNELPARWPWLPSVRVHHICLPDADRHLHDHPWNARTIVLRGWYREERHFTDLLDQDLQHICDRVIVQSAEHYVVNRIAGYTVRLLFGQYHRITDVSEGGVWTLFFTWKLQGEWGFKVDGKKVPWRQYLSEQEIAK